MHRTRRDVLKFGTLLGLAGIFGGCSVTAKNREVDKILRNGRIATLAGPRPFAQAVAVYEGRFLAVGSDEEIMRLRGAKTDVIDLGDRTVIPRLNDSHMHPIRGGLNYNMELRWDGVPSLADALRMLREQAQRTPAPQWVRVVGGWTEFQFAERRMPTLDEINRAAPDTPVFVLHLYDRALLNGAALRAVGYTKDTPAPTGGEIQRDKQGNLTGLLSPGRTRAFSIPPWRRDRSCRVKTSSIPRATSCASSIASASPAPSMPAADFKIIPTTTTLLMTCTSAAR
jgi:hypothetical protein